MKKLRNASIVLLAAHLIMSPAYAVEYEARFDKMELSFGLNGPYAKIGHFEYIKKGEETKERPVTFVMNGGPGASSIFLHMLAMGPKVIELGPSGSLMKSTGAVIDNKYSWLEFTDLVFIDPVSTGLSTAVDASGAEVSGEPFLNPTADIVSIAAFIAQWLGEHDRWNSPIVVAGESYGGSRVAELTNMLGTEFNVPLAKSILISPHFSDPLGPEGYRWGVLEPMLLLPTYAAVASSHNLSERSVELEGDLNQTLTEIEDYALSDYAPTLLRYGTLSVQEKNAFHEELEQIIGLEAHLIKKDVARPQMHHYADTLLAEEGRILDIYDGSKYFLNPLPDSDNGLQPPATTIASAHIAKSALPYLKAEFGIDNVYDYELINMSSWFKFSTDVGLASTYNEGMTLDENIKSFVAHGAFDMVTPYFRSKYIIDQTMLDKTVRDRTTFKVYPGGHMFYLNEAGRLRFYEDIKAFYLDN